MRAVPRPEGQARAVHAAQPFAAPAGHAAKMLEPLDANLAADLAGIEHSSAAVVALAYDRALALTHETPERRYLESRRAALHG